MSSASSIVSRGGCNGGGPVDLSGTMGWNIFWRSITIRFLNLSTIVFLWLFQNFSWKQRLKLIKTFHQKLFQPLDWGFLLHSYCCLSSADRERNPLSQSYSWKFCPSTKENCNFCIIRGTRFGAPQLVGLHVSKRLTGILLAMKRTYLGQSKWNTCHGPRK